ncbi:MAG: hypothetical protein PHH23_01765 [Paludibacteraceae bacterium]|nr:hypothetical protein [Paludibacteraceae bacterium]
MENKKKTSKRYQAEFVLACVVIFIGLGLSIAGFVVPPVGEVSGSVISILGITLTFGGSILGINIKFDAKYNQTVERIRKELIENNHEEDSSN